MLPRATDPALVQAAWSTSRRRPRPGPPFRRSPPMPNRTPY